MIVTYRYRVKSLNGLLRKQARAVNFVWNYCNDTQKAAIKWGKRWPTWFDLTNLTAGSSKEIGLNSGTINAVCEQYARSRDAKRRPFLRYRGGKSLGWIPLKGRYVTPRGDAFWFMRREFRVFNSRPVPEGKIRDGSNFSEDAQGNWYLNLVVEIADEPARTSERAVGVDLGLKTFATLSNGETIEAQRAFRQIEDSLAVAQRARKKRRARKLHSKAANVRRDFLHKLSTRIVREFDYVAVGNVNAAGLIKTRMSKAVTDAGWSIFRDQLRYKAIGHGVVFKEVEERFTTQVCSACGSLPSSRPEGIADLGIRTWTCSDCGALHDRDVNAAINILMKSGFRLGHQSPVVGIAA